MGHGKAGVVSRLYSGKPLRCLLLALTLAMMAMLHGTAPAHANGIALSGSFYRQEFKIPQGAKLSAPGVYVIVFNDTASDVNIRMLSNAPYGVNVEFSSERFVLETGEQKRINIAIDVAGDAAPGNYELNVVAESYVEEQEGIKLLGAAGQNATLSITGESGGLEIATITPDGTPLVAVIRVYRLTDGQKYELAYSDNGVLSARLAPGEYLVEAFMGGEKLDEETIQVKTGEISRLQPALKTAYLEGIFIEPVYRGGKEIIAARLIYTINNLDKQIPRARVDLVINRGGTAPERLTLATLAPLDTGRASLSYNYILPEGWQDGPDYRLQRELYVGDKLYASSGKLNPGAPNGSSVPTIPSVNTTLAVVVFSSFFVLAIAVLLLRRRRVQ